MPTTRTNGIDVYYERRGRGEPLVLIGGLGADLTFFAPVVDGLAEHFDVVAFDNRGAGRSDKPDEPYTIETMADDTVGLMDSVGIEQAQLVGISMGGSIALAVALDHPERVRAQVLVSASARKTGRLRVSVPFRLVSALSRVLPIGRSRYPQPQYAFERQQEASRSFDCISRLDEIAVETLIVHGRKDRSVTLDLAEELHEGIHGSELMTFKGGHAFFLFGERKRFLEATVQFLRRHPVGSAAATER